MASPRPASLARRAFPAVAIAGLSGVILVQLDQTGSAAAGVRAGTATARTGSAAGSAARSAVPTTVGRGAAPSPTTVAPRSTAAGAPATRPSGAPTTAAPRTGAAASTPAAAGACTGTAVDGPSVNTRWGPIQVAATFDASGRLCDVKPLAYPNDRSRSIRINQVALPILHDEAVAAGSAQIDVVSGATITSDAYATSLQAILDAHH